MEPPAQANPKKRKRNELPSKTNSTHYFFGVWVNLAAKVQNCQDPCAYRCVETTCKSSYKFGCIKNFEDYVAISVEAK